VAGACGLLDQWWGRAYTRHILTVMTVDAQDSPGTD
jgi:hypothetical protein